MSMIWKDGQFLDGLAPHISHDDSGFANGLGVFDSMLAKDGNLIDAAEHFERIVYDARIVLGFDRSWHPTMAEMSEVWQPLLRQNNLTKGYARVKTIVTGGMSHGPLSVSAIPSVIVSVARVAAPEDVPVAVCAIVSDFKRVAGDRLENCKRLDYSRSFAARAVAEKLGANEAILINTDGNIACAATSNIFIREGKDLYTPPLSDGALAGVVRRKLVEQGAFEESIGEARLRAADEIFLTNSFAPRRAVTLL